jgi:hypothetical protein
MKPVMLSAVRLNVIVLLVVASYVKQQPLRPPPPKELKCFNCLPKFPTIGRHERI